MDADSFVFYTQLAKSNSNPPSSNKSELSHRHSFTLAQQNPVKLPSLHTPGDWSGVPPFKVSKLLTLADFSFLVVVVVVVVDFCNTFRYLLVLRGKYIFPLRKLFLMPALSHYLLLAPGKTVEMNSSELCNKHMLAFNQ